MFPASSSADSLVWSKHMLGRFARNFSKSATTREGLKHSLVRLVEHKPCALQDLALVFQYALEIKYDEKAKEDVLADLTNWNLGKGVEGKAAGK